MKVLGIAMSDEQKREYERVIHQFRLAAATALTVLAIGMVFYHLVEKLSWLNAIYFSVTTLATVGYGDIVPKTDAGKIFTMFYILIGIGIIATFANLVIKRAFVRREMKQAKRSK